MIRDEKQTRKKINRITQLRQTHIYALIVENFDVKKIIHDRQERRTYMIELTLNSINVRDDNIVREIDDDENDSNDFSNNESDSNESLDDDTIMLN